MTHLPVVSGREALRAFSKIGYRLDHQTGSHLILRQQDPPHRRLTVPDHRELDRVRPRLVALLKDFETRAERQRREGRPAYDFASLWGELGLARPE